MGKHKNKVFPKLPPSPPEPAESQFNLYQTFDLTLLKYHSRTLEFDWKGKHDWWHLEAAPSGLMKDNLFLEDAQTNQHFICGQIVLYSNKRIKLKEKFKHTQNKFWKFRSIKKGRSKIWTEGGPADAKVNDYSFVATSKRKRSRQIFKYFSM